VDSSAVKTLNRLVAVLNCFTREQPSWSLAELNEHLMTPKSTLHRMLSGLETHGILRRDGDDRRWRLGYQLVAWGSIAAESTTLRDLAKPAMRRLMEASGETALLTVYHGGEVICIDICETPHPVRLQISVGERRPAHAGASSKVLMAYLPVEEVERIMRERGLPRLCTNTITDPQELQADLANIGRLGYAISLEETDLGAWGVATPICDRRGRVVAAIGLAGPATRFGYEKVEHWVALCRQAANDIAVLMHEGGP